MSLPGYGRRGGLPMQLVREHQHEAEDVFGDRLRVDPAGIRYDQILAAPDFWRQQPLDPRSEGLHPLQVLRRGDPVSGNVMRIQDLGLRQPFRSFE